MNTTCSFAYTGRKAAHCRRNLQVCRTWTALGPGRRQRQSLLIHDSERPTSTAPERTITRTATTSDHHWPVVRGAARLFQQLYVSPPCCSWRLRSDAYFYYEVSVFVLLCCHSITHCLCVSAHRYIRNHSFVCVVPSFGIALQRFVTKLATGIIHHRHSAKRRCGVF